MSTITRTMARMDRQLALDDNEAVKFQKTAQLNLYSAGVDLLELAPDKSLVGLPMLALSLASEHPAENAKNGLLLIVADVFEFVLMPFFFLKDLLEAVTFGVASIFADESDESASKKPANGAEVTYFDVPGTLGVHELPLR